MPQIMPQILAYLRLPKAGGGTGLKFFETGDRDVGVRRHSQNAKAPLVMTLHCSEMTPFRPPPTGQRNYIKERDDESKAKKEWK